MTRVRLVLVALFAAAFPHIVRAHEVRPALIEVVERSDGRADVTWRQPIVGDEALALRPRLDRLIDRAPDSLRAVGGFSIARWRAVDLRPTGLEGRTLRVDGLERTITDVLAVVRQKDGDVANAVLTPARPGLVLAAHAGTAVRGYLTLGIGHILTGADHLLFVLGLLLLSAGTRTLLKTITAFTVAHSITLGSGLIAATSK